MVIVPAVSKIRLDTFGSSQRMWKMWRRKRCSGAWKSIRKRNPAVKGQDLGVRWPDSALAIRTAASVSLGQSGAWPPHSKGSPSRHISQPEIDRLAHADK